MGWLLTGKPVDHDVAFDDFFVIIGRGLYIATGFEAKCRYILRLWRLAERFRETQGAFASIELVARLKDRTLGGTIDGLRSVAGVESQHIPLLERARDARNFIAHESANVGGLYTLSPKIMAERLAELRLQLQALAPGDDLVSRWVYEVQEREPASQWLMPNYADLMPAWVLGDHEAVQQQREGDDAEHSGSW